MWAAAEWKRMVLTLLRAGLSAAESSASSFSNQLLLFLMRSSIKQADNVAGNHSSLESIAVPYQMWANSQPFPQPPVPGGGCLAPDCWCCTASSRGLSRHIQARAQCSWVQRWCFQGSTGKDGTEKKQVYDLPHPRQQQYGSIYPWPNVHTSTGTGTDLPPNLQKLAGATGEPHQGRTSVEQCGNSKPGFTCWDSCLEVLPAFAHL